MRAEDVFWRSAALLGGVLLGVAAGGAVPAAHTEHRVILRYDAAGAVSAVAEHAASLHAMPAVVKAQALPHIKMAVVSLNSSLAAEHFLQTLERDAPFALGVPDTWVSAFDFGAQSARKRRAAPPAACSANPACRMRGLLVGDCCPVADGTILSCCAPGVQSWIKLRSAHGKFIVANRTGTVSQVLDASAEGAVFQISSNDDGTVSLQSQSGRYLAVDRAGGVRAVAANPDEATAKFTAVHAADGAVSFVTSFGLYLCAEEAGAVVANRAQAQAWEQFTIVDSPGTGQRIGNDPSMSMLWGLQDWEGYDIDAPEAWQVWTGEVGRGVTVAIIDTGIDYLHEELREQMWVNPLEIPGNGIDDDGNGYVDDVHGADFINEDGDPMDDQMHGTHCAGTIAAVGNNGIGVAGVAWRGVRLMALKFLDASGAGRTSDAIRAIDYAVAQGAKISSNSWGGGGSNSALRAAIEHAEAAGMLFLVAAGNEGANNDKVPTFPANYDIGNVLSIASTTRHGQLSHFSCFGASTVHVAAPGTDIYSTVPGNGYASLSGTSMATPHVAGLAALVWMYRPQLSMHQVREIILGSVVHLPSLDNVTVTGGMINAKNALESAWAFEPPQPPVHAPRAIEFHDADPRIGMFGGDVTITAASDETDVEYYRVYFVSGAGFQLEALGDRIAATGAKTLKLKISESFMPPAFARGLVAVSGRSSGEMPAVVNTTAPFTPLDDYGLPDFPAQWAHFGGDRDLRSGEISGSLTVGRARDEASVQHYNVYWHQFNGSRGPLLGRIPAIGYQEPSCSGDHCDKLEVTSLGPGGSLYRHAKYGDFERARISLSGPGTVTVTEFVTEHYYDSLSIGDVRLSGNLTKNLPLAIELPAGPLTIRWMSDESISGGGWAFELQQAGAVAHLDINVSGMEGPGIDVLPAYGHNELSAAMFAEVVDFTLDMGVSPAFKPKAIRCYGGAIENGTFSGSVLVVPSEDALLGNIGFYEVCLGDGRGHCLSETWTASPNSSDLVADLVVTIPPTELPVEATLLVARAGNDHGLSNSFASEQLVPSQHRRLTGRLLADAVAESMQRIEEMVNDSIQEHVSPTPLQRGSREERLVWSGDAEASVSESGSRHGCVRTAVSIVGLEPSVSLLPSVRSAVARTLQMQLPAVASASTVRVARVLWSYADGQEPARLTAKFELEVEALVSAPLGVLDHVESRLIALASPSARLLDRFGAALRQELTATTPKPNAVELSQVHVAVPQQLSPRMLLAFAKASADDSGRRLRESWQ